GGAREVEDPQGLAEVHVVLGGERERLGSADLADLGGELLGVTIGRLVEGKVRDVQEELVQFLLDHFLIGLDLADLFLELAGVFLEVADVTALLGGALYLLGDTLGLGSPFLGGADALDASRLEFLERGQVQGVAAAGEFADGFSTQVDQCAGVMHRTRYPPEVCALAGVGEGQCGGPLTISVGRPCLRWNRNRSGLPRSGTPPIRGGIGPKRRVVPSTELRGGRAGARPGVAGNGTSSALTAGSRVPRPCAARRLRAEPHILRACASGPRVGTHGNRADALWGRVPSTRRRTPGRGALRTFRSPVRPSAHPRSGDNCSPPGAGPLFAVSWETNWSSRCARPSHEPGGGSCGHTGR